MSTIGILSVLAVACVGQGIHFVSSSNMGYGMIYDFLRQSRVINIITNFPLLEKVMEFLME